MRGEYTVEISNRFIKYNLVIERNISIIRGDSATGKSTIIGYLTDYILKGKGSGVHVNCERDCEVVLDKRDWENSIRRKSNCIFFMDEDEEYIYTKQFAKVVQETSNYYVLICRDRLPGLPISTKCIYELKTVGRVTTNKRLYDGIVFAKHQTQYLGEPKIIMTEDSKSGYQFFKIALPNLECISANGMSNILHYINKLDSSRTIVIVDGAAFGSQMEMVLRVVHSRDNIILFVPESFEWLLLKSDILRDTKVNEILEYPSKYCESSEYMSYERFFTDVLIGATARHTVCTHYNKSKIPDFFLQQNNIVKIVRLVEDLSNVVLCSKDTNTASDFTQKLIADSDIFGNKC